MFYEVSEIDIELHNLSRVHSQEYGAEKWVAEGVTVFKWSSRFEHILRPHRFSMKPLQGSQIDWSVFREDRYYIHVYQTKIERGRKDLRTLHSKTIAQYLSQNWHSQYWPRVIDIKLIEAKAKSRGVNRYQSSTTSYRPRSRILDYPHSRKNQQDASEASTLRTRLSTNNSNSNDLRRQRNRRTRVFKRRAAEDISQSELLDSQFQQRLRDGWRRQGARRNRRRLRTSQLNNSHREKMAHQTDRPTHGAERNRVKRSNELDDILAAIQRVSRDVNLLKTRIDRQ